MRNVTIGMIFGVIGTVLAGPVEAQFGQIIRGLSAYDPVPSTLTPEQVAEAISLGKAAFGANLPMPIAADRVTLTNGRVWKRANNDGYVICATGGYRDYPDKHLEVAISISTGRFPGAVVNYIWNEDAYNGVGCNTSGSVAIN